MKETKMLGQYHKTFFPCQRTLWAWAHCYKTFFPLSMSLRGLAQCYKKIVRNLRIFVINQSVCPLQTFQAQSNKHSSLVRKFVNYGPKKLYNIGPSTIKTLRIGNLQTTKQASVFDCPSQCVCPSQNTPAYYKICHVDVN